MTRPLQRVPLPVELAEDASSYLDLGAVPAPSADEEFTDDEFVIAGATMRKVWTQAKLLSDVRVPVLIVGESGTGKEVTARLLHKLSFRAAYPFLKVNCAALPAELLESELFGYERGAFTGATRTKLGKFELCNKGTILLDEIAEMPAALQVKLLHVLQDRQFFRLGGETTVHVDVRILAATNVDIGEALATHKLREDLYYRVAAFVISLPPLRERPEEIPILLEYFLKRLAKDYGRRPLPISSTLLSVCMRYHWPGNLRELENFAKRYMILRDEKLAMEGLASGRILPTEAAVKRTGSNEGGGGRGLKTVLRNLKSETEISIITNALQQTGWNRKRTAQLLNISYRGLLHKLRQHDLRSPFGTARTPAPKPDSQ